MTQDNTTVKVMLEKPHTHAGRQHQAGAEIDVPVSKLPFLTERGIVAGDAEPNSGDAPTGDPPAGDPPAGEPPRERPPSKKTKAKGVKPGAAKQ